MAIFTLACEGITDQAAIENILCGFYDDPGLDEDIQYLQPYLDTTDTRKMQQGNAGGWKNLYYNYLGSSNFL